VTDTSLQFELDGLRRDFGVVLQRCRQQSGQSGALRTADIDELRRLLAELEQCAGVRTVDDGRSAPPVAQLDARLSQRKSALIEASLDPVIATDYQGRVLEFNPAAERILGYARADAIGRELADLIVPHRLRVAVQAALAEFRSTGESAWIGRKVEAPALKSDGSEFTVLLAVARIAHEKPPMLAIYLKDLTARKEAEGQVARYQERLRGLTAELLIAEESERRRLASDLHDGLSQTIALAKMKLIALLDRKHAQLHEPLMEIAALIDQANHSLRSITFELSPPVLHDLGLEPAVDWLVEHIHARYGLDIKLENDGQPKPADEQTRVIMFRAIRELLINAAKHAAAHRVHVCLKRVDNDVQATVDDDGVGMEHNAMVVRGSGLFSIRERLNHVGGSIEIDSLPGRGTSICLRAPLKASGMQTAKVKA
jgi:PAS domain S-box-containing protein